MYGFSSNFLWAIIILILIVLQWFRVGWGGGVAGAPGGGPEFGLMANGGLFIIALFILIACACFRHFPMGIGPAPVAGARYSC
ncbi:hypothetical protein [Fonticella tunisiensis]|uniref:Uncharacterized protein n=1 Tax=Fonticella tunisiensis TaxID=1096341 RepID=A0A4R7KP10_9CLOT|nr:hypothetical protein [Fonticella tunisiensis]TDT58440.1 hypothetical protein EDD71_11188 [Fonticella tunisiensis]